MNNIDESYNNWILHGEKLGSHLLILLKFIDLIMLMHILILTVLYMIYSLLDEVVTPKRILMKQEWNMQTTYGRICFAKFFYTMILQG